MRIQRKRIKGWRMPENAVYVGRPTKWGNPFKISSCVSRKDAVKLYAEQLDQMSKKELGEFLEELRGKDLACWCSLKMPCHADVLIKAMKNQEMPK